MSMIASRSEVECLPMTFDYADLDSETRIVVQQKTGEIKERIKRSASDVFEIGERLTDIKARLGHGRFGAWLYAEFSWTDRTAQNFMNVVEAFKYEMISDLNISPTTLVALAAPSVPAAAREEAIGIASSGGHVAVSDAKAIIAKHKPEPAAPIVDLFKEEDEAAQDAVEATEPTDVPEDEEREEEDDSDPDFGLMPTAVTREEKNATAWLDIMAQHCEFVSSIKRRGGIETLAKSWPKATVSRMVDNCSRVIEQFTEYKKELRRLTK